MKKKYFLLGLAFIFAVNIQAQYTDDMEICVSDGDPISGGHWTDWGCVGGSDCYLICSSTRSRSGDWSGLVPGDETTNAVLDLGNKIFGQWGLSFWVFIPEGKEAAMSLQNIIPISEGSSVVGDILFNANLESPGVGVITDSALGEVAFNFPHNEWFRIVMNWDITTGITAATWQFYVDGVDVIPYGTSYTNSNGISAIALGGILFSSVSGNNEMYLDDFNYIDSSGGTPFPDLYPFNDDMEYESGEPLEDWWSTCCAGPYISTAQANSGIKSGFLPDDNITEALLALGNRIQSEWALEFFMYIPSGKEGYFNLQGILPVGAGEWIVGNFFFNQDNLSPGIGLLDDSAIGAVGFSYPEDEWFRVVMNYNLTGGMENATWGFSVNGAMVIPEGTPFTNGDGDIATSLGAVEFYSVSTNNEFYLDDFNYINGILNHTYILNVNDVSKINFIMYPNPSNKVINIQSETEIQDIIIYNIFGSIVKETSVLESIDISSLSKGMYFVKVETKEGESVQKFIKN